MATEAKPATPRAVVPCPFCGRLNRVDLARAGDRPTCGECGRPLLLDRLIKVADADFDRVIAESDVPIVVDFYADWCGPCRMMAPTFDELAHDRSGELLIAKLDTDRNPATASRFGIRSIPTTIVFVGGREVARVIGAVGRARLDDLIAQAAAGAPESS